MPSIKILIIEDEFIIAEDMAMKLQKFGYDVTDCVDNCDDAIISAKTTPPDLIFLDIMINGPRNGIETAKELKTINEFPIIFLTSVSETSLLQRAMDTKPANYLRKPFTAEQLHVSIQIALYNTAHNREANINEESLKIPDLFTSSEILYLKDKETYKRHHISDILYIEADRTYCDICLKDGTKLKQTINMTASSEKINHKNLVKVHRSYIVNITNIDGVIGNELLFGTKRITVSEPYRDEIFRLLKLL